MPYTEESNGRCKPSYGAKKANLSCTQLLISKIGKPTTISVVGLAPKPNNPIRVLTEGNLVVKDSAGNMIEAVTGVVNNANSGSLVFVLNIGFELDDEITLHFQDILGKDVVGNEFANSFECPNIQ